MDKNRIRELLEEQNNTRNFSHIWTESGETIRPDIIRSNILTRKEQTSTLICHELKTIIDFRINEEGGGDENPTYADAMINHLPIAFGNLDFKKISELLMIGEIEKIDSFIESGYRTFSSDFKDEVKSFFSVLLNEDSLPIAFHCSAGKDRTGIFAVLFLFALGVLRDDVIKDYMETNNRINATKISEKIDEYIKNSSSMKPPSPEKSIRALETLFVVKKSWIEIFIQGTDEIFGSVESYLKDEINLDIERLRKIYLLGNFELHDARVSVPSESSR